jgi:t-SNARE complex subunit (syntaxin)
VALACKTKLQELRKDVKDIEEHIERKNGGSGGRLRAMTGGRKEVDEKVMKTIRIRSNVTAALTRKFVETMQKYQSAQADYKGQIADDAVRQVQIVSPNSTAEEIKEALAGGGAEELKKITEQAVLKKRASMIQQPDSGIKNTLSKTRSQYEDVLILESSILELSAMFNDFAMVIEEQSCLLDNIEFQIRAAKDYIDDGIEDTSEAVRISKKIRKKRCCLMMTALGATVGVLLFLNKGL